MNGSLIKRAIKASGKTQAEVADLIDISREHFSRLLSGDLEDAYVDKIRALGIVIPELTNSDEVARRGPSPETLDRIVEILDRALKLLEKDHDTHLKLINKGIDEGIIVYKNEKLTYVKP